MKITLAAPEPPCSSLPNIQTCVTITKAVVHLVGSACATVYQALNLLRLSHWQSYTMATTIELCSSLQTSKLGWWLHAKHPNFCDDHIGSRTSNVSTVKQSTRHLSWCLVTWAALQPPDVMCVQLMLRKLPVTKWNLAKQFVASRDPAVSFLHYDGIIMTTMAFQITSLTIVYSTVYSGADQRKHQSPASLAFVQGIHRGPVNSLHKWPVTRKMFPFDDVIMYLKPSVPQFRTM